LSAAHVHLDAGAAKQIGHAAAAPVARARLTRRRVCGDEAFRAGRPYHGAIRGPPLLPSLISPTPDESRTRPHGARVVGPKWEAQPIDLSTFAVAYH
jgi:hypothetical protein